MAEFDVKTSGLQQVKQSEEQIARELDRLENEIRNIISNFRMNSSAAARIKNRLRSDMAQVSDVRQKVQVLSRTLEDVARLYEDTENRITGNTGNVKSWKIKDVDAGGVEGAYIGDAIREVSERLRQVTAVIGLDRGGAYSSDPVNLCNGNYVYEKSFLKMDTALPMELRVFYNIQSSDAGILGKGWMHSFERKLVFGQDRISLVQDDGSLLSFLKGDDGGYLPMLGTFGSMEETGEGYETLDKDRFHYFFGRDGRWLRGNDSFGNEWELIYGDIGLTMVKENHGGFYRFSYDGEGRLESVSDHFGRKVSFRYEEEKVAGITDSAGRVTSYRYDAAGHLSEIRNGRDILCLRNDYDAAGRTVRQEFPDGGIVKYEYLDDRNQVKMTEQNGNVVLYERDHLYRNVRNIYENGSETFTYNENNQRTSFTDRNGNTCYYEYDGNGNLECFTNPFQDKLQYTYTSRNQIASVVLNGTVLYRASYNERNLQETTEDALGARNTYEYNESGWPTAWIQADGCRIELTYDEVGNMTSVTNTMGGVTTYGYDGRNRVIWTKDPAGNVTRFSYNEADEIVRVENANGDTQSYEYDACGNLTKVIDFAGGVTEVAYNSVNKPILITDPEGRSISMEYDKMWNLVKQTAADGGVTEYEYDGLQRIVKVTDPVGAVNRLSYDNCGNMVRRIAPDGGIHQIAYDALNRPNRVTDPCGHEVSAEYDAMGNVTKVWYEDGEYEEYQYDLRGNVVSSRDRGGYRKFYLYDIAGNLLCIKDDFTWLEQYEYYPGGLLKSERKRNGQARYYAYDRKENLVTITNQDGCNWHFTYDSMDRVIHCGQDEGISESYVYDALGNIVEVTDGEGNRTSYAYSPCGDVESVTDAMGNMTCFRYDACRRLTEIIQPEEGYFDAPLINQFNRQQKQLRITSYTRDLAGNIIKVTDPEGNEVSYTYDGCGRLLSRLDGDGNRTVCAYNPDGTEKEYRFADGRFVKYQYNALKQLIQMEDWLGITSVEKDTMGRCNRVVYPDGKEVAYEWGQRGEQKSILYPDGYRVEYLYDDALRLTALKAGEDMVSYSYFESGLLKGKDYSNGFRTSYKYDTAGKIREICHRQADNILDSLCYQYDKADRKSQIIARRAGTGGSGVYDYRYNPLGSLISVCRDGEEEEKYSYDRFGNRIRAQVRTNNQEYRYNRLNQLVSLYDSLGEHNYTYDGRGNMVQEILDGHEAMNLEFNALNRLERISSGGQCAEYAYDGFGNRTGKRIISPDRSEDSVSYVYDVTRDCNNLLCICNQDRQHNVLWDGGLLGAASEGGSQFYMNDERMSPLRMTEAGKNAAGPGIHMDSFGNFLVGASGAGSPFFGYTGYQPDEVGGLCHAGQREYSPASGRFISRDVFPGIAMVPLSMNAYAYCMNNPLSYTDPTGQLLAWLGGGIIGAVANVAGKLAGDVVKSVKSGKMEFSSWQSYVGTATGGFTSGVVLTMTGNTTAAGIAGEAAETFTTGGLGMLTGAEGYRKEDGYSFGKLMGQTAFSAMDGASTGFAFGTVGKYLKIPGLNKGRGSYEAVWKQVMTKASKGQIKNITMKTLWKGFVSYGLVRFADQVVQKGKKEVESWLKNSIQEWCRDRLDNLGRGLLPVEHPGVRNLSYMNVVSAECPVGGV